MNPGGRASGARDFDLVAHFRRFWQRYEAGEWEPHTKALVDDLLHQGDIFVDIGAWIGPVSLWAAKRGAHVIAVEPDPLALTELRRRLPSFAEIWEGAVGVTAGTLRLAGGSRQGGALGTSMSHIDESDGLEVRAWTLSEILKGRKPTLVKMDIEGYEIELLPTVAPLLADAGVPMQVALHGVLPEPEWFAGYRNVSIPTNPRGTVLVTP